MGNPVGGCIVICVFLGIALTFGLIFNSFWIGALAAIIGIAILYLLA